MSRVPRVFALAIGLPFVLGASISRAAPMFVGLGYLPGGGAYSIAHGVSDDGSAVVGNGDSALISEAFRWSEGAGMVGLGVLPGGQQSVATGASADGSVAVGTNHYEFPAIPGSEAFRWTPSGGMVGLGLLPGGSHSHATGVSSDGSAVVGFGNDGSISEAFRWTQAGGMVGLGFLVPGGGPTGSMANGVSADGSVVVGRSDSPIGAGEAFRWTQAGGMVGLGSLSDEFPASEAIDVSFDGSVVVGTSASPVFGLPGLHLPEAFRWTEAGGMVGLGLLPSAQSSRAHGASADGSVVVGSAVHETGTGSEAFIWDATNGMRELNQVLTDLGLDLTGWNLDEATDISADGLTIVGTGTNPSGQSEAWIAVIPEPGTGVLLALGLGVLARRRYAAHR